MYLESVIVCSEPLLFVKDFNLHVNRNDPNANQFLLSSMGLDQDVNNPPTFKATTYDEKVTYRKIKAIDLTDYSFLPNSLVSMLTYFSMSSTDEGYIPIFSYTKLFLVYLSFVVYPLPTLATV